MMRQAWVHREGIVMLVGVLSPSVASSSWPTAPDLYAPPGGSYRPSTGTEFLPEDKRATVVAAFGDAVVRGNETGLMREQSLMR